MHGQPHIRFTKILVKEHLYVLQNGAAARVETAIFLISKETTYVGSVGSMWDFLMLNVVSCVPGTGF